MEIWEWGTYDLNGLWGIYDITVGAFELIGSSGSEAVDGATVEPYQYKPLGSHSSSGPDSSGSRSAFTLKFAQYNFNGAWCHYSYRSVGVTCTCL